MTDYTHFIILEGERLVEVGPIGQAVEVLPDQTREDVYLLATDPLDLDEDEGDCWEIVYEGEGLPSGARFAVTVR